MELGISSRITGMFPSWPKKSWRDSIADRVECMSIAPSGKEAWLREFSTQWVKLEWSLVSTVTKKRCAWLGNG